jgi:nicotinate-nucleotide adenylyltransferase
LHGRSGHNIPSAAYRGRLIGDDRRAFGLRAAGRRPTLGGVRIGFLGGRFDPVHLGHLGAAQDACDGLRLDRIVFVPAAQVPHKPDAAEAAAPAADRLAMLRLATGSQARFAVSDFELNKGGLSYTIDTARHFRRLYAEDELFWIVGGDQLPRLPQWKGIDELASLIAFILIDRPGHPAQTPADIAGLRLHRCAGAAIATSSTELRARVKRGEPLTGLVPDAVAAYLRERRLYR